MSKKLNLGVLLLLLLPVFLSADPTKGLVAFFPFNANPNDESGKGIVGEVEGATLTADRVDMANGAYSFDGNSYILYRKVKNLPIGKAKRTLALWVKSADGKRNGNADPIVNWGTVRDGQAFGLMIYENDTWWGYGHALDLDSKVTADTEWHFFCVTYDGVEMKIYVDGKLTETRKAELNTRGNDLYMGIRPDKDKDNTFDGAIDDVYIYDRVLADAEIKELASKKSLTPVLGKNLIYNGNFELGVGVVKDSDEAVLPATGWTGSGSFTSLQYDCDECRGYKTIAGPKDRGKTFLAGGPESADSSASQKIDVAALAETIDTGNVVYYLEGWLGGYGSHDDKAAVTADFLDENGQSLGSQTLGPVDAKERNDNTSFLLKKDKGDLPAGTRSITITVSFTSADYGYNDGMVDNLSLVLKKK